MGQTLAQADSGFFRFAIPSSINGAASFFAH
jgi:hypothetical protein